MATTTTNSYSVKTVIIVVMAGALSGMLYGYDIGIINGALLYMKHDISMTTQQLSFVVSAVLGAGAVMTLISGSLADKFGRKYLLVCSAILFIIGVALLAIAQGYAMVLIGRIIQGLGVGVITIVAPLYLSESLPAHFRGRGIAAFQLMLTAGILLANSVAYVLAKEAGGDWRLMFWSAVVPAIVLFVVLFMLPESPRWLMSRNMKQKAFFVIRKTHQAAEAQHVCHQLETHIQHESKISSALSNLFNKRYITPMLIVLAIAILHQLTGINSILQLNATILKAAGMTSNTMAILGGVYITGINFVVTIVSLLLVDVLGRRKLLIFGTIGMTISLLFCALIFFAVNTGDPKAHLLTLGIIGYIFSYAIGPGVVIWLILSELLPSAIRSVGMSIGLTANSFASTILAMVFLPLAHTIGFSGIFVFCGLCAALYFYLVYCKVPETKNKSLEDIEDHFNTTKPSA